MEKQYNIHQYLAKMEMQGVLDITFAPHALPQLPWEVKFFLISAFYEHIVYLFHTWKQCI